MQFAIYLAGVLLFSAFYYQLKAFFGGGIWFVLVAVAYLLCLRLFARFVNRHFAKAARIREGN
ncbi:hypothetical protein [Pseudoxanthomonas sp. 10H]|uniref:hypothetical protein n=1 Tax=Pseudoxanthomonas sp. 10H TaxID=3242729 RepID=UPI0035584EE5